MGPVLPRTSSWSPIELQIESRCTMIYRLILHLSPYKMSSVTLIWLKASRCKISTPDTTSIRSEKTGSLQDLLESSARSKSSNVYFLLHPRSFEVSLLLNWSFNSACVFLFLVARIRKICKNHPTGEPDGRTLAANQFNSTLCLRAT